MVAFAIGSLGVWEKISKIRFSKTPKLPAAKATIKVILIYIPVHSAGGALATNHSPTLTTHSTLSPSPPSNNQQLGIQYFAHHCNHETAVL